MFATPDLRCVFIVALIVGMLLSERIIFWINICFPSVSLALCDLAIQLLPCDLSRSMACARFLRTDMVDGNLQSEFAGNAVGWKWLMKLFYEIRRNLPGWAVLGCACLRFRGLAHSLPEILPSLGTLIDHQVRYMWCLPFSSARTTRSDALKMLERQSINHIFSKYLNVPRRPWLGPLRRRGYAQTRPENAVSNINCNTSNL